MSNANEKGNNPENKMHELGEDQEAKMKGGGSDYWLDPMNTSTSHPPFYPPPDTWGMPRPSGCIVTTATMQNHHGKDDDCDELQTFRKYRDTYLVNQPDGHDLLKEYYEIAPLIVYNINARPDHKEIYAKFWKEVLEPCLDMMKNGKNEEAKEMYHKSIKELKSLYMSK